MAIVQETFDIPADIMTKLLTGEYRRIGGVARYAIDPKKGQIVKHLDPIDLKAAEQAQGFGVRVLQFAKNNKKGIVVGAAITGVVAALDVFKQHKDYEKYIIALSIDDLDVLVNRIYEYTIKLAENNDVDLTEKERSQTNNSIINLQNYLEVQRHIFEKAS